MDYEKQLNDADKVIISNLNLMESMAGDSLESKQDAATTMLYASVQMALTLLMSLAQLPKDQAKIELNRIVDSLIDVVEAQVNEAEQTITTIQ